jgi:hypothetical protein
MNSAPQQRIWKGAVLSSQAILIGTGAGRLLDEKAEE